MSEETNSLAIELSERSHSPMDRLFVSFKIVVFPSEYYYCIKFRGMSPVSDLLTLKS